MKKIDCVSDITMENVTLDDLGMAFAEADERVRQAHSVEEVVPILRETYLLLRVRVLEDYIAKGMESKPDKSVVKEPDTVVTYYNPESAFSASAKSITPIPRPSGVPDKFCNCSMDAKVYPGEILYLNLDGRWRPYRVMSNENGTVRLLGLFSIGKVDEGALRYFGSLSSQLCDAWYAKILSTDKALEDCIVLSKIGDMAFYVHIPDWDELQKDCFDITEDLISAWYDDDDMSNIQVYTGRFGMTSFLCGEDGELHEYHYGEDNNDDESFISEVHPSLTLRLGSIPYYYDERDRADLREFS